MASGVRSRTYRAIAATLGPPVRALPHREFTGQEHLPSDGGFLVASNHLSHADPLYLALYLHDAGFSPRFLGKAELFSVPLVGTALVRAGQIPVHRGTGLAGRAYHAAVAGVREGECVAVYPEGTLTRDPDLWPMVGRTGAARIALDSGAPVVPVAQWGPQDLLAPYARVPRVLPRPRIRIAAGPPVDLDDLRGRPLDADILRDASARIMAAITELLAGLRGVQAPAVRFDPRAEGVPLTGNPRSATMRGRRGRSAASASRETKADP
jgi:1-acyl-sn-glycerol-3-phosphate acyltransferase